MKRKNGKKYCILAVLLAALLGLTGCCLSHTWGEADCVTPKICSKCEKTEGEPLGHTWVEASCIALKTCSVCGAQEGAYGQHAWADATCAAPKTCTLCAVTEGEALPHTWMDATCTAPKTCSVCGAAEGESAAHPYDWTVTQEPGFGRPGTKDGACPVCGATTTAEAEPLVPAYDWGVPVTLELSPDAVEVCVSKDDTGYWVDVTCPALSSRDLIALMVNSPLDWGVNKQEICNQVSKVLSGLQDAWQEGSNACCSMEADGKKWITALSMDENANGLIRLKVDNLESFQAVTGLNLAG